MRFSVLRSCAVAVVALLVIAAGGMAVADQGDALLLGVTTNSAQSFDTKLSASSDKFGLWVAQKGEGAGLKGSTGGSGGAGVVGQTSNDEAYGVDAVNSAAGGTGLHATGKGLAAAFDGDVALRGSCEGCLGRPGFGLVPGPLAATTPDPGNDTGQFVSATIGADGLPLITYQDATAKTLNVAHCRDAACTSAVVTKVSAQLKGTAGFDTSVTIGADGLGLISFTSVRNDIAINFLKVAHCENLACTSATVTVVDQLVGDGTSIIIGADGFGLVSYQTLGSPQRLKFAHCQNVACTASDVHQPASGGLPNGDSFGADSSLILSPYDQNLPAAPMVTFLDTTDHSVWVARCSTLNCAGLTAITQLATGADSASLTIGDDGRGLVAVGSSTQQLRFVHCQFLNSCSSFDTSPVPILFAAAAEVSLSIGPDGRPILLGSYPGGAILTVPCLDTTCSTFGPAGFLHEDGSPTVALTIGADGLPLAAFYDTAAHQLAVVHCPNAFCAPYFRRR
jgi:hypothetical protein